MVDPFHPKASGGAFAGFQGGASRAEAAANDEDDDERLEDQNLVMSRLACSKVCSVRSTTIWSLYVALRLRQRWVKRLCSGETLDIFKPEGGLK